MPWNRPLIIGLLLVVLTLTWWRLQPDGEEVRRSRIMMGTVVEIMAAGQSSKTLEAAVEAAFAEMERLDKLLSRYHTDSEVSRLSQSANGGEVSLPTAEVLTLGLEISRKSGGAFDMTLGKLKTLWAFDKEAPTLPKAAELSAALSGVGPKALSLEGQQLRKASPQLQLDLGGIAKGYAVDRAIAILKQHGVANAAVNAGGDMYLLGQRMERAWRIGIQHPREEKGVLETVQIRNRAVVTSGDYERFFEKDGLRYHHIFNPQTGMPARDCQSVTIVTDSVALGDALATAVFVLGPKAGLKLLEQFPQAEGLVIAADGSRHNSPGWTIYQVVP
ncbi:FAD:protein FMN transferase [Deltaproteobacteria bacterium IMCC39524]|nr:FAD:protein FMN transferase [Deltaproteobacteria bacterium IMCC39524]